MNDKIDRYDTRHSHRDENPEESSLSGKPQKKLSKSLSFWIFIIALIIIGILVGIWRGNEVDMKIISIFFKVF